MNDIVVEFGNARYQDLMDRFTSGEEVSDDSLRKVWQNTTQPHFAVDLPIYEEFFRAVRAVNASLPPERQLRVLLGDPPIDWKEVHSGDDILKWTWVRDTHAVDLIRREVIAKQRRALIVYGGWHLQRKNVDTNYEADNQGPLVSLLQQITGAKLFTIWTNTMADLKELQNDVEAWPTPSLAILRGTLLGAADFTSYFPSEDRFRVQDGKHIPIPRAQWRNLPMEDQFDAVLYLGPRANITQARLSPTLCSDQNYFEMRVGRMTLAGFPPDELERFKRLCGRL